MPKNNAGHGAPGSGKQERYIQPCLLMALMDGPTHGYDLLSRIAKYGFMRDEPPPGMIYRHLRQMEEEGLTASAWDAEGEGPARRIYSLTDDGREALEFWAEYMERLAEKLDGFVRRYREKTAGRG